MKTEKPHDVAIHDAPQWLRTFAMHFKGETRASLELCAEKLEVAPEMLEALKRAELSAVQIRIAAGIGEKTLRGKIAWYEGQLEQVRDELRSVIAKAEGRA